MTMTRKRTRKSEVDDNDDEDDNNDADDGGRPVRDQMAQRERMRRKMDRYAAQARLGT
jgi:hypothetical protein